MAHREFTDGRGHHWEVWEVVPTAVERRKKNPRPYRGPERRHHHEARLVVPAAIRGGWLAFQSAHERRRLSPTPAGWEDLPEIGLEGLLATAAVVGRARRLIE